MIQLPGKAYIARHGETVFNSARRIQGDLLHTPLTRAGIAQAEQMGAQLAAQLGKKPRLSLWSSPTGRALQTLAIIAEHLDLDWHAAHPDARLVEIGMGSWDGRYYPDIIAETGDIFDPALGVFTRVAPGGESYADVADRLRPWVAERSAPRDRLIIMHGVSSQVLRGLLTGGAAHPNCGTPVGERLPQGSVAMVENGQETVVVRGTGA
ncbi:2,3-bisphosphoglycerate-dependent phosphoglycerate mutase [Sphingomonas antarctica]|uniref:histidine phosphatase family protein n=1 Tax=Sphingomonas antarctica TaxID=2040274 RepID=UPI0039E842B9